MNILQKGKIQSNTLSIKTLKLLSANKSSEMNLIVLFNSMENYNLKEFIIVGEYLCW